LGQLAITKKALYKKEEVLNTINLVKKIYYNKDLCFVRIRSKTTGKQKMYATDSLKTDFKLKQILDKFGKADIMLSLNPFKTITRGTRNNLFCINNIAVDVDYKKVTELKDLTPEQVINLLEMDCFDSIIPAPNLIEFGNQIRLIYTIETCYIPKDRDNVVRLAERVTKVFAERLKDFGAEKQDVETYFRLPGTTNTKNNSKVRILYYNDSLRYTLNELQELWLDELPSWYKQRKGRSKTTNKVVKLHNVFTLNSNRITDMERIQEHLNNIKANDFKARLCFLYRNFILVRLKYQNGGLKEEDFKFAEEEMLKFNAKFRYPLRENIIESATRYVNKVQYLYQNDTLVNFLEMDYELAETLGLQSIYKTKTREERNKNYYEKNSNKIIKKEKKKYANKLKQDGKINEKDKISLRRAKIKDLLREGLKQKDICKSLDISKDTYLRDRKFLKEQGLM